MRKFSCASSALVPERLYVIHPAAGSGRKLLRLGHAQIGELGQCFDGSGARASNIGYAPRQGETAPAKILAGHPQKIFGRELFSGAGGAPVPQKIGSQPALGSGRCCWRLLARPESRGSLAVIGACPTGSSPRRACSWALLFAPRAGGVFKPPLRALDSPRTPCTARGGSMSFC
jgi:hypothetical protein